MSQKDLKIVKLSKKENTDINQNFSNFSCSATSSTINSCKPEPTPISSLLTTSAPSFASMIAHWNPSFNTPSPQMPNSITTMVTHCLRLPSSPTFSLCSCQEYQDDADKHNDEVDFKQWLAEFREELRADRNKILDEMRKDFSLFKEI